MLDFNPEPSPDNPVDHIAIMVQVEWPCSEFHVFLIFWENNFTGELRYKIDNDAGMLILHQYH